MSNRRNPPLITFQLLQSLPNRGLEALHFGFWEQLLDVPFERDDSLLQIWEGTGCEQLVGLFPTFFDLREGEGPP